MEDPEYITQRYYPHIWKVAKSIQKLGYFVVFGSPHSLEWMQWWMQQLPWRIFYFYGHGLDENVGFLTKPDPTIRGLGILARQNPLVWIIENDFPDIPKIPVEHDVRLSSDEGGEHYRIVFINACSNAYRSNFCDAFHIDRPNKQAAMYEAYIGSVTPLSPGSAAENGEKFWQYFVEHPNATVYEAYREILWSTGFALPYKNAGDIYQPEEEWLKEAPGQVNYNNPPYYNFRP